MLGSLFVALAVLIGVQARSGSADAPTPQVAYFAAKQANAME